MPDKDELDLLLDSALATYADATREYRARLRDRLVAGIIEA